MNSELDYGTKVKITRGMARGTVGVIVGFRRGYVMIQERNGQRGTYPKDAVKIVR